MSSFWIETAPGPELPSLTDSLDVDVAVVGGGITGLLSALRLQRDGRSVAVLEAHRIIGGETGRTTAHVSAIPDIACQTLRQKFGASRGAKVISAGMDAVAWLEQLCVELAPDADFKRQPAYYYSESAADRRELEKELAAATRLGLEARFEQTVPLPFATFGAVRYENQGRFHPRRLLLAVAAELLRGGARIFEHSHVEEVTDGKPCIVRTAAATVRARDVIVGTDSPMVNRFFLQTKLAPARTYVIAARVAEELPGLFWDTDEPYHYIRTHPTPEGPVLIVGGEDHRVGEEDEERRFQQLWEYTRERFKVTAPLYRWSGQVQEPVDGLPYIGRNSLSKHIFVATGYSGNGMGYGTLAAMMLSDAILKRRHPLARTLAATRIRPLAAAKMFTEQNVDYPVTLAKDRLAPAEASSLAEVPVGEGRITRVGAKRYAVYRDESGQVHAKSPVCTHMGCFVHWNGAERSWDCPCHGSRFGFDGRVLHGPAVQALRDVSDELELEAPSEQGEDAR